VWGGKRSKTRGGTFPLFDKGSTTANVNTLLQATGKVTRKKQNQNDMPLFATKSRSSQNLAHSVFLMVSAQNGCVLLRARPFDIRQFNISKYRKFFYLLQKKRQKKYLCEKIRQGR